MKQPTLQTVAERCGVSASTVSRALTRPNLVNPEARARILAVATEIGYRPNKLARGLVTGRLGRIGLLVPDVANPFFTELLRVVHQAASATAKSSVLIVNSNETASTETDLIAGLLGEVDGVIVASARAPTAALRQAVDGAAAVFVNRPVRGEDSLLLDYRRATEAAGDHLAAQGHRRIALVRGPTASWAATQRSSALTRWAADKNLELVDLGTREPTVDAGLAVVGSVVDSGATAVVAYDDMAASGVIAGLHAVGLAVPDDVAVIGCDDTILARMLTPSMTTISPPYAQLGMAAVQLLMERIADRDRPAQTVRIPCELVIRESTIHDRTVGPGGHANRL